jgi:hypothetical protein
LKPSGAQKGTFRALFVPFFGDPQFPIQQREAPPDLSEEKTSETAQERGAVGFTDLGGLSLNQLLTDHHPGIKDDKCFRLPYPIVCMGMI